MADVLPLPPLPVASPSTRRQRTLTVPDVARLRGTSRQAALTWLQRNAAKHLRKKNGDWIISARAYAMLQQADTVGQLRRLVHELSDRVGLLEKAIVAHASALSRRGSL